MIPNKPIKPHKNPQVEAFLVRLRSISCCPSNPNGVFAQTMCANLAVRMGTLRAWLRGACGPHPLAAEVLMGRLDKICGVGKGASNAASPAAPPQPPRTASTVRPNPIPKKV